jgi:16S rRNA (guanine966-N2)-methyltransferase
VIANMRIIAGKLRGRKLISPRGQNIRPTSDRLRQTLFDIVGAAVSGGVFLDVFAGTGAVGLEALSRGAREVLFIESDPESCRLIEKNLDLCGARPQCRLIRQDVFTAVRHLARAQFAVDAIYLDPPYAWEPYGDLLGLIFRLGLAAADTLVVVEHHRKAAVPGAGQEFRRVREVVQSDKCLSFYRSIPETSALRSE